jgi:exopolysaccharide production protein ExoQ
MLRSPDPRQSLRHAVRAAPQTGDGNAASKRIRGVPFYLIAASWVLLIAMTVPTYVFTPLEERALLDPAYAPNTALRIIKLSLLVLGAGISLQNWAVLTRLFRELNRAFIAFLIVVPLSYLWSISPVDTLGRFVTLMQIVALWTAICVVGNDPRRFQNIIRPFITFIILGSIVFAIASPDLAIERGEGTLKNAWRGLTGQKNIFGPISGLGWIFWFQGWLARELKTWKAFIFGGCCLACVFLSHSSTSLMATIFASIFLLMLLRTPPSWRRVTPYLIGIFATTVITFALSVLKLIPGSDILLRPITTFTGKDMTFSNRSLIWDIIKEHIQFNPFIGSGYGAYWIGPNPASPSYTFMTRMYFYPTESHNGYLEIINDLGTLGFIVLVGYLVIYLRQSLKLLRVDRSQAALYLAIFFQQSIMNLSESCWLTVNSASIFTIVTFATIAMARSNLDQRMARSPAATAPRIGRPYQHQQPKGRFPFSGRQ